MPRRHCKTCGNPLHADDTHRVCVTLGEIPCWRCAQRGWLLALRAFQSCLSALTVSFLFRERLRPSHPPVFFLPGICEKKQRAEDFCGQWQASSCRLNARMPRRHCRERESIRLSSSLNMISVLPPWATWSRLVRVTVKKNTAFFSGGFGRGRVFGLCDWPRPLNIVLFM